MIKYGNWVYEGLSTEIKPGYIQGALDGNVFKEIDTGESYNLISGVWVFINLGLSFIKATKSGKIITDVNGFYHVIFITPFINNEYTVALSVEDTGGKNPIASWKNIAVDGFDIFSRNSVSGQKVGNIVVSWLATRNYNI